LQLAFELLTDPQWPSQIGKLRHHAVMFAGELQRIAGNRMKNWEVIADNLSKAGWSYGFVSMIDSGGRTIWIVDAHCGDGKRHRCAC
jgi:hypothetical protein